MIASDLASGDSSRIKQAVDDLKTLLETLFPSDWLISDSIVNYTPENKQAQWQNELQKAERDVLEDLGPSKFGAWLGEVHYASVTVTWKGLFEPSGHVRENAGWRLSWLALPAANVFIVGLAHHYQGTPAQNRLAGASNYLHEVLKALSAQLSPAVDLDQLGRKVERKDWDLSGLTETSLEVVGRVWEGPVPLRLVRNTTTKKILSTFITVRSIPVMSSDDELLLIATQFRQLMLGMTST